MNDSTSFARQSDLEKMDLKIDNFTEKLSSVLIKQAVIEQMQNTINDKLDKIETLIENSVNDRSQQNQKIEERLQRLEEKDRARERLLNFLKIFVSGTLVLMTTLVAIHFWNFIKMLANS